MLERMRIVHLDTRKCSSIDASRSGDAVTPRKLSPAQVTAHQSDWLNSRSQLSKGAEAEYTSVGDATGTGATGCTPRERNIKSAPLGARDANSQGRIAKPTKKNRVDTLSSAVKDRDNATTTSTLVRNPFSPDKRRRLTTNTTGFLSWASSSSIVHDFRQDTRAGRISANSTTVRICHVLARLHLT